MTSAIDTLQCGDDSARRTLVRASFLNGLDEVEVDGAQTTLIVTFLGRAPQEIGVGNLRIEGGRRVRDLRITDIRIERAEDDGLDDRLFVSVDRPGDFSSYRLCWIDVDAAGNTIVPAGVDPRYACACFSFKAECASDLDCAADGACDDAPPPEPPIDYLAKDYASLRRLMLDRLALLMPAWKEQHVPDIGITLVELLAYAGDYLSYQQDAVATEAYLETARQRISVRRHLRLIDYLLHEGCNARTWLVFEIDDEVFELRARDFYAITPHPTLDAPVLDAQALPDVEPAPFLGFEPVRAAADDAITLRRARNRIAIHTWGQSDCCIARGATSATLRDPGTLPDAPPAPPPDECDAPPPPIDIDGGIRDGRWHQLKLSPCDVLVFEEVLGPHTGDPADADPSHRHAVRLTRAQPAIDPLTRELVYEVEWCVEDALPFALCLTSVTAAPDCTPLVDVSVAWGNVILVDHGLGRCDPLPDVPCGETTQTCADDCDDARTTRVPGRYRPRLPVPHPTCVAPVAGCDAVDGASPCCGGCGDSAASVSLRQDVRAALPAVALTSTLADDPPGTSVRAWQARPDLLYSGPDDSHFVVEIDDRRLAWLRFGDGNCGRAPVANERFEACWRVGNGAIGNVGADALTQLVFRDNFPDGRGLRVRNPLPAVGGTAPERVDEARLRAPQAMHLQLERAITAADYAAIVARDFAASVQGATAELRDTGVGAQVQVAVDARGRAVPEPALLRCIEAHLRAYRRIGHDVGVIPARQVPLDIALHVCVKPDYLRAHVKTALLAVLGTGRLPAALRGRDGRTLGFFNPDALEFGQAVSASRLVAAAQAVDGVAGVVLERLERLFEGPDGELAAGVLPIAALEIARLDNDPDAPENGRLTLTLEGGR